MVRSSIAERQSQARLALLCALLCLAFGLLSTKAAGAATTTFGFTDGEQTFTVPNGVTSLEVLAIGGRGGTSGGTTGVAGGFGAAVRCNLAVTPGQILFINVGGNGSLIGGGFNGGAPGGDGDGNDGGGGGGATDIRTISRADAAVVSANSRLVTAGGGGGGGGNAPGGTGGGAGGGAGAQPSGNGTNGTGALGGTGPGTGGFAGEQGGGNLTGQGSPGGTAAPGVSGGNGGGGGGGRQGGGAGGAATANDSGGGGGGGGASHFAQTATQTSIQPDNTAAPLVRLTYNAAGGGGKSGLKFGKVKRNKNRGTAILPVTVPGTGELSVGGKGVVKKRPTFDGWGMRLAKEVTEAGTVNLKIKSKGRKKAKLFDTGNVRVKAVITFKPTSGDPVKASKRVRLKKN